MPVPTFHPHEGWQWQRQTDDTATLVCLHGGNSLRRHFKLSYKTIFTGFGAADYPMRFHALYLDTINRHARWQRRDSPTLMLLRPAQ